MKLLIKLLLTILILTTINASEQTPTQEEVAKLYVATFNRAPDSAGLSYWVNNSGLTLSGIAKSFFVQTETQALYPEGTTVRAFIQSVYQNLFNRAPDSEGLKYWEDDFNLRGRTRDSFILAMINGAKDNADGMDKTILNNKNEVGLYFANAGLGEYDFPTEVMSGVTADSDTVAFIKDKINSGTLGADVWDDENKKPIANAGIDQSVNEGENIILSATSSSDSDGYIASYVWKEGNTILSTLATFSKTDFDIGSHTVILTVTDNDGSIAADTVIVTVQSNDSSSEPVSIVPINYLNNYRENAGMISFIANNLLDQSAFNHALYLVNNNSTGHSESSSYPYFTGASPANRAEYVGYKAGINENLTVGYDSFKSSIDALITAIYHRFSFFNFSMNEVGIDESSTSIKAHVFNMGNSYLEELCQGESFTGYGSYYYGICADATFKIESSQYLTAKDANSINNPKIVIWPYENQQDFQPAFFEESPDPLPECGVSGNPISIQFNEYYAGDIDMISFKLFDTNHNQITNTTVYDATSDINNRFSDKEFALFPIDRLDWNTEYTAEFKYKEDGVDKTKSWIFKTKQIEYPYYIADQNEENFYVKSNTNYVIYLPPVNCNDDRMYYTFSSPSGVTINTRESIDPNLLLINISGAVGQSIQITHQYNGKIIHLIIDTTDEAIR